MPSRPDPTFNYRLVSTPPETSDALVVYRPMADLAAGLLAVDAARRNEREIVAQFPEYVQWSIRLQRDPVPRWEDVAV